MIAIADLTRTLEGFPAVQLAVLFGSAARTKPNAASDIDVGISLEHGSGDEVFSMVDVALQRAVNRAVDLVSLDEAPPLLRFEIARNGLVLVQREPHAWAEFRAHAMIDWWDWAPTARMMHQAMTLRLAEEARRGPS